MKMNKIYKQILIVAGLSEDDVFNALRLNGYDKISRGRVHGWSLGWDAPNYRAMSHDDLEIVLDAVIEMDRRSQS